MEGTKENPIYLDNCDLLGFTEIRQTLEPDESSVKGLFVSLWFWIMIIPALIWVFNLVFGFLFYHRFIDSEPLGGYRKVESIDAKRVNRRSVIVMFISLTIVFALIVIVSHLIYHDYLTTLVDPYIYYLCILYIITGYLTALFFPIACISLDPRPVYFKTDYFDSIIYTPFLWCDHCTYEFIPAEGGNSLLLYCKHSDLFPDIYTKQRENGEIVIKARWLSTNSSLTIKTWSELQAE
jgi:hypothetical protein